MDQGWSQPTLRLYTHNVRYATRRPFKNEKPWSERKHMLVSSILLHTANDSHTIVCLQEVLHEQLLDILDILGSEWSYFGVGRDDGRKAGEYSPILYRASTYHTRGETFWLSPTPNKPSRGWDAALNRIVSQVHFLDKFLGHRFIVYCTHFDHAGAQARLESAKLIVRLLKDNHIPQFVCGDFNSQPAESPYEILSEAAYDSERAPTKYGHSHTYTSFGGEPETRIDYIFHTQGRALRYGVLHSEFGSLFSDHRPVVADITLH